MSVHPQYFDVIVFDEHFFGNYFSEQNELVVFRDSDLKDWQKNRPPRKTKREIPFGQLEGRYAIAFTGPFHALQPGETTYIFSERTGTFYVPEGDVLRQVSYFSTLIANPPEHQSAYTILIVDKDQHEVSVYNPTQRELLFPLATPPIRQQSTELDARHQSIEQSLRSALAVYGWLPEESDAP